MLSCWQLKNSDRPTFSTLAEQIEQHYSDVLDFIIYYLKVVTTYFVIAAN